MEFTDRMRNGLKPEWQVLNSAPGGVTNEITYAPRGVKMRNNNFDITGTSEHFSLLLNEAIPFENDQIAQVTFTPSALAWGAMQCFLHDTFTDSIINTASGPFGITQGWDPANTGHSYLYMQHGSSLPIENTKIEIVDPDEPITLRLRCLDNGKIKATAMSDQWDDHLHTFGESNQDTFGGKDLFFCIHNVKSYSAADGANMWSSFKAYQI